MKFYLIILFFSLTGEPDFGQITGESFDYFFECEDRGWDVVAKIKKEIRHSSDLHASVGYSCVELVAGADKRYGSFNMTPEQE